MTPGPHFMAERRLCARRDACQGCMPWCQTKCWYRCRIGIEDGARSWPLCGLEYPRKCLALAAASDGSNPSLSRSLFDNWIPLIMLAAMSPTNSGSSPNVSYTLDQKGFQLKPNSGENNQGIPARRVSLDANIPASNAKLLLKEEARLIGCGVTTASKT